MGLIFGVVFAFLFAGGYGIISNVFMEIFHVSKGKNDMLSLLFGLMAAGFIAYIGLKTK